MTDGIAARFEGFYERLGHELEDAKNQAWVWIGGLQVGVALIGILVDSGPWVWLYLIFLDLAGTSGLLKLRRALSTNLEEVRHLGAVAGFLEDPHRNQGIVGFVEERISPTDSSNVPEALRNFLTGERSFESVQAASEAAFGHASNALNWANFIRAALVLGGLFGTVLFFALELTGDAIAVGNIEELLPGLRGALASTLTGILGSLLLGVYESRIGGRIDRLVLETQAFLGGPVASHLINETGRADPLKESDLWEFLRQEVAQLREDAQERFGTMGADAHAFAVSLQTVSDQLASLPAIQVPEELSDLFESTKAFSESIKILDGTVGVLVDAVSQLGILAPTKMLEDLSALRKAEKANMEAQELIVDRIEGLDSAIGGVDQKVEGVANAFVQVKEDLDYGTREVVGKTDAVLTSVAELNEAVSALTPDLRETTEGFRHVSEGQKRIENRLQDFNNGLGAIGQKVEGVANVFTQVQEGLAHRTEELVGRANTLLERSRELTEAVSTLAPDLRKTTKGFQHVVGDLSPLAAELGTASAAVERNATEMSQLLERSLALQEPLRSMDARLSKVDAIYEWCSKPLWRVLLAPLWARKTR